MRDSYNLVHDVWRWVQPRAVRLWNATLNHVAALVDAVRQHFRASENATGWRAVSSCFFNLWLSGRYGKEILLILGCVLFFWMKGLFMGEDQKVVHASNEPVKEWEAAKRQPVAINDVYGPQIKGVRLGMDYDDVLAIANNLLDKLSTEDLRQKLKMKCKEGKYIGLKSAEKYLESGVSFTFEDGKLIVFCFQGEAMYKLFGVSPGEISYDQFLQLLLDKYGIPCVTTQTYTSEKQTRMGSFGGIETLSFYDGSDSEGYAFKCREYKGTGRIAVPPYWSFVVQRYVGLNFDLPKEINMDYVKKYQYGIGPVVKGLRIGMTRDEVVNTVKLFWKDAKYHENRDSISYQCGSESGLDFSFKNGRVCKFCISNRILEVLFRVDSKYFPFKDFAQQVIDYYGISSAAGETMNSSGFIATKYTSIEDGIEFYIGEARTSQKTSWGIRCRKVDTDRFD